MRQLAKALSCLAVVATLHSPGRVALGQSTVVLEGKVPITLRLLDAADGSRSMEHGEVLAAECAAPVMVSGVLIVSSGAPAAIEVENVSRASALGAPAEVTLRPLSVVAVDGSRLSISGMWLLSGQDQRVEMAAFFPLSCLFASGRRANDVFLQEQSAFVGYLDAGQTVGSFPDGHD